MIKEYLDNLNSVLRAGLTQDAVEVIAYEVSKAKIVYVMGNGGSAATSNHIANDLVKVNRVNAVSLSSNPSIITAYANDTGYENVFSQQMISLDQHTVCLIISVSGSSPNIIQAAKKAIRKGATIIGVLGKDGGDVLKYCKHSIVFRTQDYGVCEDAQSVFGHVLTRKVSTLGLIERYRGV